MAAPVQSAQAPNFANGAKVYGLPMFPARETAGRVFFVDSTSPNKGDDVNHGAETFSPFATLAFALGQCVADRGDLIYILNGHTETITTAAGLNFGVAGVTVIGMGPAFPLFTYLSSTAASADVNAANVRIERLRFATAGIDNVTTALLVKAARCTIFDCEFELATLTNQTSIGIKTNGNADEIKIIDCEFFGADVSGSAIAIELFADVGQVIDRPLLLNNNIVGHFSNAAIYVSGVVSNLRAIQNTIQVLGTNQIALRPDVAGSTGQFIENRMLGTDIASLINNPAAGFSFIENYGYDTNDAGVQAVLIPLVGSSVPAGNSLIDQILGEFSSRHANHRVITASFNSATWNTVGKHRVLNIDGPVRVICVPIITTSLTSGGGASMQFGTTTDTDRLITTTAVAALVGGFWLTATPSGYFARAAVLDFIVGGAETQIGYEVTGAAFTGGVIEFHFFTVPLQDTDEADVTDGNGSTF